MLDHLYRKGGFVYNAELEHVVWNIFGVPQLMIPKERYQVLKVTLFDSGVVHHVSVEMFCPSFARVTHCNICAMWSCMGHKHDSAL